MTELVDVIKVEITLRHCLDELRIEPLRGKLQEYWPAIAGLVSAACVDGTKSFHDGKIVVRYNHSGLHEIPEESGGDN